MNKPNIDKVIQAIIHRQSAGWNGGAYYNNENYDYSILQELFEYINTEKKIEKYFYKGDIYRIHCQRSKLISEIDTNKEYRVGRIYCNGSCGTLPITQYSNKVTAFSKSFDFVQGWNAEKTHPSQQAVMFWSNTKDLYGIDVNSFLHLYGCPNEKFEYEKEVLFPITQNTVIKEYHCSPNQFKYYMRK